MQHQIKVAAKKNNVGSQVLWTCEILGAQYTIIIIMIFMKKAYDFLVSQEQKRGTRGHQVLQ